MPEPAESSLLLAGLSFMGAWLKRRKNTAAEAIIKQHANEVSA
jgi:hypothetical protein